VKARDLELSRATVPRRLRQTLNLETPMTKTKQEPRHKQTHLFEAVAHRPRWEDLPTPIREELTLLLKELLLSRPAQELLRQLQKGDRHE
jgi:hypothetical protein